MSKTSHVRQALRSALAFAAALLGAGTALAQVADLSSAPLAQSASSLVAPNVMFILDNSGSMAWDYNGDYVNDANTGKPRCSSSSCYGTSTTESRGDPPWYTVQFNQVAYNPQETYVPGVNYDGSSIGSQTSWNAVLSDPYTSTATVDITSRIPEIVYCRSYNDDPQDNAGDMADCRRNGIDTTNPFLYNTASSANGYPDGTTSTSNYRYPKTIYRNPFYYTITPVEYCSDEGLSTCIASSAPSGAYVYPAPVRWCKSASLANAAAPVTGKSGNSLACESKRYGSYIYARYGQFTRTDIVPTATTYGGRPDRTDCAAAPSCTYAEEMTNYANWYAYYRTRINMMKTSAGIAFARIGDNFRVGFITINLSSTLSNSFLPVGSFDATQKQAWYSVFYSQIPGNSTPLRQALSRVGRYFAHRTDGINSGMNDDPVQYACQQNVAILTTDGYWNGAGGVMLDGTTAMDNEDNNASQPYSTRAQGVYDGGLSGASGTLADTALYYWRTDLRPNGSTGALGTDVGTAQNVPPVTAGDTNKNQHMVTFTLGLADGLMTYQPDYDTSNAGDFAAITTGATGCWWNGGGTCNWPVPVADDPTALDDLWHAAVNGRGKYYNAQNANALALGLSGTLATLRAVTGSAAAAATSSPNITQTDNFIYSSMFRTVKWDGEVIAQQIDPSSGNVLPTVLWSAQALLDQTAYTARTLYTFDAATNAMKSFAWSSLTAGEQAYFANQCAGLSQCASLTGAQQTTLNDGATMLSYLSGNTANADGIVFRQRDHILGDTVNATPAYVQAPQYSFADLVTPTYASFKSANAARQGVVYIAANDGMLHAFNADTGVEMWAYVPRQIMPRMSRLADVNYASNHIFLVDGSPQTMDVYDAAAGAWRTILVGGLNDGGRGYYALDVTDPANPKALWEVCSDSTLCNISDQDIGYSYGNPIVVKRASDERWVAVFTSGYNNVNPGDGQGYLYVADAITGQILQKIADGAGSTSICPGSFSAPCPSGLGKISAWDDSFNTDNTAKWIYGGDLMGNVWRFDLTANPSPQVLDLATLRDATGRPQSITSRPELGLINGNRMIYVGTGRYIGLTDIGNYAAESPPLPYAYENSFYAFKDDNQANGDMRAAGDLVFQTVTQSTDAAGNVTRTTSANPVNLNSTLGWAIDFNPGGNPDGTGGPSPGERMVLDPQLVQGTILFTTMVPGTDACTAGGSSWTYQMSYDSGAPVPTATGGIVATETTQAVVVGNVVVRLPSGALKTIQTQSSGQKQTAGINIGGAGLGGKRVGWHEITR